MTVQEDIDKVDTIEYTQEESGDEPFNMAIDDTANRSPLHSSQQTYTFQLRR